MCGRVNSTGVVLGLLRGEALHAAPEAPVALAMESGPTTIRPDRTPKDIREHMRQHGATSVVVTTPAGQLMGVVERRDIERCLAPAVQPHEGRYRPQRGTPSVEIGYKLSCEEHSPSALVCYAKQAEDAGFTFAMLSDHYHPWIAEQGQSPFVWSVIGSIAQATERLRVGTGVTCPLIRTHPAIKIWQRTTPVKVWVNAILTGSLRACSPQDKCKLP
jgi:CBS domain-containing protein